MAMDTVPIMTTNNPSPRLTNDPNLTGLTISIPPPRRLRLNGRQIPPSRRNRNKLMLLPTTPTTTGMSPRKPITSRLGRVTLRPRPRGRLVLNAPNPQPVRLELVQERLELAPARGDDTGALHDLHGDCGCAVVVRGVWTGVFVCGGGVVVFFLEQDHFGDCG